jgi:hypothetical protein
MPASRILEGRLPEQHPSAHIFFGSQPQPPTANGAKTGYQGRSPWLVRPPSRSDRQSRISEATDFAVRTQVQGY